MQLNDYKLSLLYHIQMGFIPFYQYYASVLFESLSNTSGKIYTCTNKPLKYIDASGNLGSYITVYDDSRSLAPSGEYTVNYVDSSISLINDPSGVVTASYTYDLITVLDSFPDNETFSNSNLPILAVEFGRQKSAPFSVGTNASWWDITYTIDLFAQNDPMRTNIVGQLTNFLSKEPFKLIDFSDGPIINFDGSLNSDFNATDNTVRLLRLQRPSATFISFDKISDKEKYRALITGTIRDVY